MNVIAKAWFFQAGRVPSENLIVRCSRWWSNEHVAYAARYLCRNSTLFLNGFAARRSLDVRSQQLRRWRRQDLLTVE